MTEAKPPRTHPFGMQRRHYIAIRVLLAVGIVVVGVTLHHHGPIYIVIRVVYFALIVSAVVWRIRRRRAHRRGTGTGS
jgi:Flp pilus assembly protein TadB